MDPQLLVAFPETENLLVPALLPTGFTVPVATVGGDLATARVQLDELAAAEPDAPLTSLARPEDLAVIISSGGTTGVPKGSCRSLAAYSAMVTRASCPAVSLVTDFTIVLPDLAGVPTGI